LLRKGIIIRSSYSTNAQYHHRHHHQYHLRLLRRFYKLQTHFKQNRLDLLKQSEKLYHTTTENDLKSQQLSRVVILTSSQLNSSDNSYLHIHLLPTHPADFICLLPIETSADPLITHARYGIMELSFPCTFAPTSKSFIGGTFAPMSASNVEYTKLHSH